MSLTSLTASLSAAAALPLAGAMPVPQISSQFGGVSGWDASNFSTKRGYVYFPTLNTQRELPAYSRLEQLRRARYLTRNVGFAKRCTHGLAGMVGYLSPRAFTDDKDWNADAQKAFERQCGVGQGLAFDRSGRFNFYAAQPKVTAASLTDGDMGIVLTEGPTKGAMAAFYESHQCGSGSASDSDLRDGVRLVDDRAVSYRLLDTGDSGKFVDVPAQDFILHGDYFSFGHSRGVTALHHAITNLLDTTEIRADVKTGIKLSNRMGFYLAKQQMTGQAGAPKGMGSGSIGTLTNARGEAVLSEQLFQGPTMRELAPGEEIKTLLDQRPHPNSREFLEDLNRDIAYGIGLSPDILWNIAKLGGASVRYVLAEAQTWIEARQQLLVDQFLHRFWVYFISKEIKYGRLRAPRDPEWYWKCGWQPQAKLTVDVGRDGRLSIDLHRAGMLTLQRWYGQQGLDYEVELKQHVREYALKLKICDEIGKEYGIQIDPAKVFPPPPGSAPNQGSLITPDQFGNFGDPENISRVLVDDNAHLRAA
jgi:hypothetical protein